MFIRIGKKAVNYNNYFKEFFLEICLNAIRGNQSFIASRLRRSIYGTQCFVDTNVFISNRKNFQAYSASCLYHSCYILNQNGTLILGNNSHLGAFCYVNVCHGNVTIGNDVAIGPGTKIIAYSNHYKFGKKVTEERITENVLIKDNVFIGANCTILPGTTIHSNVIVGANAVVKGELQSNAIYVGVPCEKIKENWYE